MYLLEKIKKKIAKKVFKIALKKKKKNFSYWFNLYSSLKKGNLKVNYKEENYFIENSNWKFYHKKQGLHAYGAGLAKRAELLRREYLLDNIIFKDNDIIIDCGANNGDFYLCFANDDIIYYGIEPSPIVFSNLEYNVPNQFLINKGLWSNTEKKIDFYLSDEFGDSSIFEMKKYTKKIQISTTTLDQLIGQINKKIKLLKIESEGAEPEILSGLNEKINMVEYITVDAGFERGVNQESTLIPCVNYLTQNNFEMIDFCYDRLTMLFKNKNFEA